MARFASVRHHGWRTQAVWTNSTPIVPLISDITKFFVSHPKAYNIAIAIALTDNWFYANAHEYLEITPNRTPIL